MSRVVCFAIAGAALIAPSVARAEIIIEVPARKVCVGPDGAGIRLRMALNHGDKPSRRFWFRLRVYNPSGRLVYSERSYAWSAAWFEAMNVTPRRLGVYRTVFEAYGWSRTVYRTRVYGCR